MMIGWRTDIIDRNIDSDQMWNMNEWISTIAS